MRPLTVAMIAPFGIRPKGTLAARMLPLAHALSRRGHCISIVAPPLLNPQDAGSSRVYDGVTVAHSRLPCLPGPAAVLEQAALLRQGALKVQPDLLYLFKPKGYGGLAVLAPTRLPLIVDSDDWEGRGGWNELLPYPPPAKALFTWQEFDLPRRAAAVTVASRTLETQVWGAGVEPQRVFYLPNGISELPPAVTRPARPARTLLLYTRFWEFAVADVVAALAGIVAAYPEARLLLVGRGERNEQAHLLELAGRAGLAAQIDYRGWVEPAQLPELFALADIALVPMNDTLINRARGLAKLLELMAAGLPIVAGKVGQVGEYLAHGESGWLVAPGEAGALAQGALRLLHDAELRARLGAGARRAAAAHCWDRLAPQAEAAFALALTGSR
jgi:glycosyltransferase involved in cell wall biosynthesis